MIKETRKLKLSEIIFDNLKYLEAGYLEFNKENFIFQDLDENQIYDLKSALDFTDSLNTYGFKHAVTKGVSVASCDSFSERDFLKIKILNKDSGKKETIKLTHIITDTVQTDEDRFLKLKFCSRIPDSCEIPKITKNKAFALYAPIFERIRIIERDDSIVYNETFARAFCEAIREYVIFLKFIYKRDNSRVLDDKAPLDIEIKNKTFKNVINQANKTKKLFLEMQAISAYQAQMAHARSPYDFLKAVKKSDKNQSDILEKLDELLNILDKEAQYQDKISKVTISSANNKFSNSILKLCNRVKKQGISETNLNKSIENLRAKIRDLADYSFR
nr:hypothetical protein [uncultured Campylobacter sp.]